MRIPATMLALLALAACSDPSGPPRPAAITAVSVVEQQASVGAAVNAVPSVRVTALGGRPMRGVAVDFRVDAGEGVITGAQATTDANGVATLASWTLGAQPGLNRVVATASGLTGTSVAFTATAVPAGCATMHVLNSTLGQYTRLKSAASAALPCLFFDPALAAGHEYLLLLENMPVTGPSDGGLFPGTASGTAFAWTLRVNPLDLSTSGVAQLQVREPQTHAADDHAWDFGAGRIRELHPETPPELVPQPQLLRAGTAVELNRLTAEPVVGDTIQVMMEGIPRLGIDGGNQQAVIRHVTPHIIIAEDVRLTTALPRQSGSFNTPLTQADLNAIATEYANSAMIQGDLLFENRHNSATEGVAPNRVIAVHSLMPADDIWGYTYSATNYFVWDYWVATNGSTKGLNQQPQRVADNLFMHEIAHMRHWGMLQRAGSPPRGNRWLVEGFARFTERLPIAARLLGSTNPSRTGNVVLPLNPAFNNAYFLDDVPTYGSASAGMFFGYQTSAFVFDYFADQVALSGGDWRLAVRELVTAAGRQITLDPVVERWLPGNTFADLFTRARLALYLDDIGTSGLPAWTQYHQYQLRQSRALPQQLAANDPRNAWSRLSMAAAGTAANTLAAGAAAGFLLDGAVTSTRSIVSLEAPAASNVTLTLVRIR